mmetsp:Transcript_2625/g.3883  ORF Transcript_2625/g.3883 Transcript_2625/m.3883 type:complete len:289 (-) Transcript_2625:58-924(-)
MFLSALGSTVFFPEEVKGFLGPFLKQALVTLGDTPISMRSIEPQKALPSNIIIHQNTPSIQNGTAQSMSSTITTVIVGTGACWAAYMVVTNVDCIPDCVKEMLPVTRHFFEQTSKKLGRGIVSVKEALEEQILGLMQKQEDLGHQQEVTHDEVLNVKDDLKGARDDLTSMRASLDDHSRNLEATRCMQSHSTRGVNLLVRAVATFLPTESTFVGELAQFIKDGDETFVGKDNSTSEKSFSSIKSEQRPALVEQSPSLTTPKRLSSSFSRSSMSSSKSSLSEIHALLGR